MDAKRQTKKKFLIVTIICSIIILILFGLLKRSVSYAIEFETDYIYLSDLNYIADKSYAYYSIGIDKNQKGDLSTLIVDSNNKVFGKSISAWADSEVVYDISYYTDEYTIFSTYIGIDVSQQSTYFNNGATINIYTSVDGEEWDLVEIDGLVSITAYSEATYVEFSVEDVNYIKLEASKIGSHWYAYWYDDVIYANPMIYKEGYEYSVDYNGDILTVEEYDEMIYNFDDLKKDTDEYTHLLLKREFVNNVGYDILQALILSYEGYKDAILWIFNDYENLKDYTVGGTPDGTYTNALKIWAGLYSEFKEDLYAEGLTTQGIEYSDLYKRMLYSLSLTHSTTVGLWAGGRTGDPMDPNDSYANERYTIYKELHLDGLLDDYIFEYLEIEEMRYVMNNIIDDESIKWFNYYISECNNNNRNPYNYITYRFGYEYLDEQYYSAENYNTWNDKYYLSDFGITYEYPYPKPWIVMEEGGVCGAISKTGSNIFGSFGVPSSVIGQPGHAAYIVYSLNSDGNAIYTIWNNISGWGYSGKTEKLSIRMPNGWGSGLYVGGYPVSYILLAQEALNNFDEYEESELILLEAGAYSKDYTKLEEIYRKALSVTDINLDAWIGLVTLYKNSNTKSEEDIYNLILELSESLKYHPRPMYDLMSTLYGSLTSAKYQVAYSIKLEEMLQYQSTVTSSESYQDLAVREVANLILGAVDNSVANFSFSGEDAGVIKLASKFEGSNVQWDYSIDGGVSYKSVSEDSVLLTTKELELINVTDDIIVHIVGTSYDYENLYYIDILEGIEPINIYNNDLENIVAGATNEMQWRLSGDTDWNNFEESTPNLNGDATVEVRTIATDNYIASNYVTLYYTENEVVPDRSYVSLTHISLYDFSTEQDAAGHYASNALDGNVHTIWHSTYDGDDFDRYIVMELDKSIYLSALEYVPRLSATNGIVGAAELYGSIDGINFELLNEASGWGSNNTIKSMDLEESVLVKYIKFKATETYSTDSRTFISALMFNIYEDTSKLIVPTADLEYDINVLTNNSVTVKLVNPSEDITITNNGGSDEYTFVKNGTFTFEFVNSMGTKGTLVASVDYIDKEAPILEVIYSDTDLVNYDVLASVNANEEFTVLNNNGLKEYTFEKNGYFTFIVSDKAGNTSSITAAVNNIDKEEPLGTLQYSIVEETTLNVTVSVVNTSSDIESITSNGVYTFTSNGIYVFTLIDKAGNVNYLTAAVDWIVSEEVLEEEVYTEGEPESNEPLYPDETGKYDTEEESTSKPEEDEEESKEDLTTDEESLEDESLNYDYYGNETNNYVINNLLIILIIILLISNGVLINKRFNNKNS